MNLPTFFTARWTRSERHAGAPPPVITERSVVVSPSYWEWGSDHPANDARKALSSRPTSHSPMCTWLLKKWNATMIVNLSVLFRDRPMQFHGTTPAPQNTTISARSVPGSLLHIVAGIVCRFIAGLDYGNAPPSGVPVNCDSKWRHLAKSNITRWLLQNYKKNDY